MVGEVGEAGEVRPRRREGVALHVVPSEREGSRYVLEDEEHGRYSVLRGGERDQFIWERLDGTRTLHDLSLEFLDEHGALPRDLAGLVARLAAEGMIEGTEPEREPKAALGKLQVRALIPGLPEFLTALGGVFAPLARPAIVWLALVAGLVGLGFATYARTLVALRGKVLLLDGAAWRGVVAALFLSFIVSCLESLARAAALRRGSRVRGAGLALPLGLPGVFVDDAAALVLPVEQRVAVLLAPLAVALLVGAGASVACFELLQRGDAPARVIALLGSLAWVGFLRALFHANPIGPSGVASALATWSHIDDLPRASSRFFTHGIFQHKEHGFEPRERILLAHGAACLAWLIVTARTLGWFVAGELVPHVELALRQADRANAVATLVPLALACVPLVGVVGALLLALARAVLRALAASPLLGSPRGAGSLVAALALLVAFQTSQLGTTHACAHAALAGLVAALLAILVPSEDGRGRAAHAITAVALAAAIEAFAAIFVADAASHAAGGALRPELERGLAWMHTAARFFLLSGACLELATASRAALIAAPLGWLAALAGVGVAALPFLGPRFEKNPPFFFDPALALGAALFYMTALVASRGALRASSRVYLFLAALALSLSRALPALEHARPLLEARKIVLPAHLLTPRIEAAALVLALGLLSAALVARSREGRARRFAVPVGLGEDRTAKGVLASVLASMPHQADEHLGHGAADVIEATLASGASTTEQWAALALKAARRVAGERWLARFLDGVLARVPSAERARVGRALANVPALTGTGQRAQDGAGPEDQERVRLFRAVPILGPLPDPDVKELALLAVRERVPFGQTIMRQGEEGDRFYVIAKGEAQVSIHGKDGHERTVAHLREGDAVGEGALLRHEPRAATVTASAPLDLLVLDRDVFLEFIQARKHLLEKLLDRLEDVWMVRAMGIFSELDGSQVAHLFQRFKPMKAHAGAAVIEQGARGDRFYVVREGALAVEVEEGGEKREVAQLARGDYFGEMALLHDAPRVATVRALSEVELLALDRDDFLSSIAPRGRARLEEASKKRQGELDR